MMNATPISHPDQARGSLDAPVLGLQTRDPPWVLWHLCSFDGPTVAALWTWFFARANGIRLPWTAVAAMAVTLWLVYAADRLLDGHRGVGMRGAERLEARHRFHRRHRTRFFWGIAAASVAAAWLLPTLPAASVRLYLVEGGFLAAYLVLVHATRPAPGLSKEFAVGIFFAAGTFIATVTRAPGLRTPLLIPALLFAALCSLNGLFIHAWEHPWPSRRADEHASTRLALAWLPRLAVVLLGASVAAAVAYRAAPWTIPAAIALATALMLALHRWRDRLGATALRTAADLALLTPALLLGFLPGGR